MTRTGPSVALIGRASPPGRWLYGCRRARQRGRPRSCSSVAPVPVRRAAPTISTCSRVRVDCLAYVLMVSAGCFRENVSVRFLTEEVLADVRTICLSRKDSHEHVLGSPRSTAPVAAPPTCSPRSAASVSRPTSPRRWPTATTPSRSSNRKVVDVHVSQLWRYPIKSLGAEPLGSAQLTADGIAGDRIVDVHNANGPLTGRSRHRLLTVPASTGSDGVPRVAGHPWTTAEANQIIQTHAGADSQLVAYTGPERFDVLNLLVATDGAVRAALRRPPAPPQPAHLRGARRRRSDVARPRPGHR